MEMKEYVNSVRNTYDNDYAEYEIEVHFVPMGTGEIVEDAPSMVVKMHPYLTEDEYITLCASDALSWFKADYDEETDTTNISDFKSQIHAEMRFAALLEFYTDVDTDTLSSEDIMFLYWNTDLYRQMMDLILANQEIVGYHQLGQLDQLEDDAYELMEYYKDGLLKSKTNAGDDMVSAAAQIFYLIVDMLDKLDDFVGSLDNTLIVDGKLDNNAIAQMLSGITNSRVFKDLLKVFVFNDDNNKEKEKKDKKTIDNTNKTDTATKTNKTPVTAKVAPKRKTTDKNK